jgi:hypothetical protein
MAPHKFKSTTDRNMNNHMETLLHNLLARVAKLEAQANHIPGATKMVPEVTDEELKGIWDRSRDFEQALRAICDRGVAYAQAGNLKGSLTSSTPPPVATDEELRDIWDRAYDLRAIYDLGVAHGQASRREVAEPAPVAGEVAELVADLRIMAAYAAAACQSRDGETLTRFANTLQQLLEQEAER